MLDSPTERSLVYRLAVAHDCWGQRRAVRHGVRNGIWFLDPTGLDEPAATEAAAQDCNREERLAEFVASGRFTRTELATLRALVVERLTIDEVAQRDGCSRQAVLARLVGNSRGQGGILKKAQALLASPALSGEGVQQARGRTPTRVQHAPVGARDALHGICGWCRRSVSVSRAADTDVSISGPGGGGRPVLRFRYTVISKA